MQKFVRLALLLPLLTTGILHAAETDGTAAIKQIEWIKHYGKARKKSDQTDRPVLLFLTMEGCIHCVRMQHLAFKDKSVITEVQQQFVPAMLKIDGSDRLARDLRVTVFPTTVFIAPDGKILDYVRGYLSTDALRTRMSQAVRASTASVASRPDP